MSHFSLTRSLQSTLFPVPQEGTNRQTNRQTSYKKKDPMVFVEQTLAKPVGLLYMLTKFRLITLSCCHLEFTRFWQSFVFQ